MEEALRDIEQRETIRQRIEDQTSKNFPVAAKSVQRCLVKHELKTAEYNELRYLSRKPFNFNKEERDNRNEHIIRHPDEQENLPTEFTPKTRPLRGYLDRDDY